MVIRNDFAIEDGADDKRLWRICFFIAQCREVADAEEFIRIPLEHDRTEESIGVVLEIKVTVDFENDLFVLGINNITRNAGCPAGCRIAHQVQRSGATGNSGLGRVEQNGYGIDSVLRCPNRIRSITRDLTG